MIKYRTLSTYAEIVPAEVERETRCHVFIDGVRVLKMSRWSYCYFDTWEEAWAHLSKCSGEEIKRAEDFLEFSHERRVQVLKLQKPEQQSTTGGNMDNCDESFLALRMRCLAAYAERISDELLHSGRPLAVECGINVQNLSVLIREMSDGLEQCRATRAARPATTTVPRYQRRVVYARRVRR